MNKQFRLHPPSTYDKLFTMIVAAVYLICALILIFAICRAAARPVPAVSGPKVTVSPASEDAMRRGSLQYSQPGTHGRN